MTRRRLSGLAQAFALVLLILGLTPVSGIAQTTPGHGIDPASMDLAADSRVDFYRFVNGGWLDRTTIPSDRGGYNTFNELSDATTATLLDLLDREAAAGDLQGAQFDAQGNLRQWWTRQDIERFQALNDQVVAQYNAIELLPGVNVNGQITVTENVADLGGVQVAYQALEAYLAEHGSSLPPPPALDGAMSAPAAASNWRAKIREEALLNLVRTGVHAPATVRGTQPLRNMDSFFTAFGIEPGDPVFFPAENRVVIW